MEGLVRGAVVPAREPPARPLPPAPPARGGGPRPGRCRPRRRGGGAGPGLLRRPRAAAGDAQVALHGRRRLQAGLRRAVGRVPGRAGRSAVPGAPGPAPGEPAACLGLQDGRVPRRHGGRAALPGPSLRPVRGALRPGPGRARLVGGGVHHRPPPGAGLRLLHAHDVRVRGRGVGRGAERGRGRWPLRRPGRAAGRGPDPGDRVRDRYRAGAARVRRRGRLHDLVGGGRASAARLRDRHRGRRVRRGPDGRAAPGRPAGRPGLRRALHEVPDQVGRPLGRPGGARDRPPGTGRRNGRPAAPAHRFGTAQRAPGCHCGRAQGLPGGDGAGAGAGNCPDPDFAPARTSPHRPD